MRRKTKWGEFLLLAAVAAVLVVAMLALSGRVFAQNFAGGFRCETATGSNGESVRALFRADGHLAYFRENPDGVFMRQEGCGGSSTECSNAVRACFGVEIGIETPLGVISALDGPSAGRTIFSGVGIWFALFVIGVLVYLVRDIRSFLR